MSLDKWLSQYNPDDIIDRGEYQKKYKEQYKEQYKQRARLEMMLRTGMMDQEDYNETIAAMDVRNAGRAPSGTLLQGSQTLSYEEWLGQVDSKLMELAGFNLKHAKVMIPTLDINRLFPGDESNASTPEETAQDILTIIEGKA